MLNKIKSPKYQPSADELALAHDYLMRTGDADTAYDWQVVKAIVIPGRLVNIVVK